MNKADAIAWLVERYENDPEAEGALDGMIGNIELGWIEPVGIEDGELRFRLTDTGRRHVEGMTGR